MKDENVTSGHFKGLFYVINIMWKDDLMDYFGHRNPQSANTDYYIQWHVSKNSRVNTYKTGPCASLDSVDPMKDPPLL